MSRSPGIRSTGILIVLWSICANGQSKQSQLPLENRLDVNSPFAREAPAEGSIWKLIRSSPRPVNSVLIGDHVKFISGEMQQNFFLTALRGHAFPAEFLESTQGISDLTGIELTVMTAFAIHQRGYDPGLTTDFSVVIVTSQNKSHLIECFEQARLKATCVEEDKIPAILLFERDEENTVETIRHEALGTESKRAGTESYTYVSLLNETTLLITSNRKSHEKITHNYLEKAAGIDLPPSMIAEVSRKLIGESDKPKMLAATVFDVSAIDDNRFASETVCIEMSEELSIARCTICYSSENNEIVKKALERWSPFLQFGRLTVGRDVGNGQVEGCFEIPMEKIGVDGFTNLDEFLMSLLLYYGSGIIL